MPHIFSQMQNLYSENKTQETGRGPRGSRSEGTGKPRVIGGQTGKSA